MARAAVYARVSRDRGDSTSVEEQLKECEREAPRWGWELADRYEDRNQSASRPGTRRPAYEKLLEDIEAGQVQRLAIYMTDRLYRQPRELEGLIELVDRRPVEFRTVRSGDLDLSTPEGRAFARTAAAWNKLEVEKLSERSGRGRAHLKENGGWLGGGATAYGYERVKNDRGKVAEHRVREDQAAVIREVVRRALAGETLNRITQDLNARGVTTSQGGRWQPSKLRQTLTSAFLAGRYPDGAEGNWPAIISEDEHRLLRARFPNGGNGVKGQKPARAYALSGMLICSECGRRLLGSGGRYVCSVRNGGCGKVRAAAKHLDEHIKGRVFEHLDSLREPEPTPSLPEDESPLLTELRYVDARLLRLREEHAVGDISLDDFKVGRDALLRRKEEVERQIREQPQRRQRVDFGRLMNPTPLDWNEGFSEFIERIVVTPAERRGRGAERDIPSRVAIEWRQ